MVRFCHNHSLFISEMDPGLAENSIVSDFFEINGIETDLGDDVNVVIQFESNTKAVVPILVETSFVNSTVMYGVLYGWIILILL